jgi:hypothetical protein
VRIAASGDVEVPFANSSEKIDDAPWEALAETKNWRLDCPEETVCTVYGQFRDGTGNESLVVDQQKLLQPGDLAIYMPVVMRN